MIIYILINCISFGLYGIDKYKAKKHHYRISETTLLVSSCIAPLGSLFGMFLFHHKTKKLKFYVVGIGMLCLHFFLYYYFFM